jgi:hypothetical protein
MHGKRQKAAMTMDIDEPRAVGEKGISPAEARARAVDVNNREFLDTATNRRTKYLGTDPRARAAPRAPISVADDPAALITRRFSEVTEMRAIFDEALNSIKNPNQLRPTELKARINKKIWDIIKTGTGDAAVEVRSSLAKLGFENVQGQGYVLRTGPPRGSGAAYAEESAGADPWADSPRGKSEPIRANRIPTRLSASAWGAGVGAALGATYSLLTTGHIDAKDVAVGAAIGAFPILAVVGAKDEGGVAVPIMLYFGGSAAAETLAPFVTPLAAAAAPAVVVYGTAQLMGGQTTFGLHGGWGGLHRYPHLRGQ